MRIRYLWLPSFWRNPSCPSSYPVEKGNGILLHNPDIGQPVHSAIVIHACTLYVYITDGNKTWGKLIILNSEAFNNFSFKLHPTSMSLTMCIICTK